MTATATTHILSGAAFEEQAASVLGRLRGAIAAIVSALPDEITSAADLDRILAIGNTPSWQIHRTMGSGHPLAIAPHVPGASPMRRFFAAAARRGVPEQVLESGRAAYAEFEGLVKTHAPNRRTFDSMISGVRGEASEAIPVQERRAAFRANSAIWGVQARAALWSCIYHPGPKVNLVDWATVRGYVDLCRLRTDVVHIVAGARRSGADSAALQFEAIDNDTQRDQTRLLQEFCSKPLPDLQTEMRSNGYLHTVLPAGPIGSTAAVTYVLGEVKRGMMLRREDGSDTGLITCTMQLRVPVEVALYDTIVYSGMFDDIDISAKIYRCSVSENGGSESWLESDRLPVESSMIWLGRGPGAVQSTAIPRYPEMIEYVCGKLGWDAEKFDVYRCVVEYPVLHSTQVIQFEIKDEKK